MASQSETCHNFTPERGYLEGSRKDRQSITADWEPLQPFIHKVEVRTVSNVIKDNGVLTEVYRRDWCLDTLDVAQVFQVMLVPGGISAWHAHQFATDRLFVNHGTLKVILYDARQSSPTYGLLNEFRCGLMRPTLIVVPPGVWHGVQNIAEVPGSLLNVVDRAYTYEDPDHWRLPWDSEQIPYRFSQ